jgi:ubiquinone/menaquinone biosynthesis C-methylase UbiE
MRARQRVIDAVVGQFVQPRGLAGMLVGWDMTVRPSNRKRNLWAVDLLEVQPTDRVLEIGFGPGVAIRALARRASAGSVYGIDHSEVMVRRATTRNRAAVERGRVILRLGSAADLSAFGAAFDKVLVVNNFGMWPDPLQSLGQLRSVMRPGGRVAVGRANVEQLRNAAFTGMRTEVLNLRPPVVCVLAEAPEPKNRREEGG